MAKQKQSFGVIIATRNIFNFELAVSARKKVLEKLDKMGFGAVILPSEVTPTGNIEGYEDAVKCAKYFKEHADQIDGIVVVLANFGDELGVVNTIQMAGLNVPVLVQACDDDNDKVGVKNAGMHSVASFLYATTCTSMELNSLTLPTIPIHWTVRNSPMIFTSLPVYAGWLKV